MPKATKAKDEQAVIEGEVMDALSLQRKLDDTESELMLDPRFKQYLALRDEVNQVWDKVRAQISDIMIPAYQAGKIDKSIKGSWGSITVTERQDFEINQAELPAKFIKKVADTTLIRKTFELTKKEIKGAKPIKKFGLMMKFNKEV